MLASCTQRIVIVDTTPPEVSCPPNVTVECGDDMSPETLGYATAVDNCDPNPMVTIIIDQAFPGGCPGELTIFRVWSATDICGNGESSNICFQQITVLDRTPPEISCPNDITIECGTEIPVTTASAIDICDSAVDVTYSDSAPMGTCPMVVIRTFIATDDCLNTSTCTQRIIIVDTTAPDLVCAEDVTIECGDPIPVTTASVSDDCDPNATVTYSDGPETGICPMIIVRTFVAVDECGNSIECTQRIIIEDTTPPILTCPDNITIECDQDPTDLDLTGMATGSDICDPDPVITIAVDIVLSNDPCSTVIQRVWQATGQMWQTEPALRFAASSSQLWTRHHLQLHVRTM